MGDGSLPSGSSLIASSLTSTAVAAAAAAAAAPVDDGNDNDDGVSKPRVTRLSEAAGAAHGGELKASRARFTGAGTGELNRPRLRVDELTGDPGAFVGDAYAVPASAAHGCAGLAGVSSLGRETAVGGVR